MWIALGRGAVGLVFLAFLMWVTRTVLDPLVSAASSGSESSPPMVTRVGSYFGALTLENLTVIAGLAVAVFLLGRAATERRVR